MRTLCDRYGDVAELMADEAAVRASGGEKAPLASALLVFDASGLDHVAGISDERVDSLLGQPKRWRLPVRLTASSLIGLSSLAVLMWRASEVASAHVTLNLPIVSSQPCLMILMTLPVLGAFVAMLARRGRSGPVGRPLHVAIPH
jgi:hypothetical protein